MERSFEVGKDEAWFANIKRTYDEYQQESLESIKRNRTHVDKILVDAQQDTEVKRNLINQCMQNAIETSNMVAKQAVRHGDLAIDRQWNIDEQSYVVAEILRDEVFKEAMAAAVTKYVHKE
jgi:enoyl-CoA hydratase/carnithine racemase